MYDIIVKIVATILATILSIFNISVDIPGFSDENTSQTTIEYLNEDAGSMDADILITTSTDGEFKLYWADEDFEKLTYSLGNTEIEYSEFAA